MESFNEAVSDILEYPQLVYYLDDNPGYRKQWVLSDIPMPTKEYYDHCMCDMMTLGRPVSSYEEFCERFCRAELSSKIASSKCKRALLRFPVANEVDLKEKLKNYMSPSIKFMDLRHQVILESIR